MFPRESKLGKKFFRFVLVNETSCSSKLSFKVSVVFALEPPSSISSMLALPMMLRSGTIAAVLCLEDRLKVALLKLGYTVVYLCYVNDFWWFNSFAHSVWLVIRIILYSYFCDILAWRLLSILRSPFVLETPYSSMIAYVPVLVAAPTWGKLFLELYHMGCRWTDEGAWVVSCTSI